MELSAVLALVLSSDNPLLPGATAMRVALHGVWAVVLGSGALLLARFLPRPYPLALAFLLMSWTLLPGTLSPAYWLGLAFQTPSLTSAVICLAWFLSRARRGPGAVVSHAAGPTVALKTLAGLGLVLGWVLLLDTFAGLPLSVYAWGFSPAAVAAVAVLATLLWAAGGAAGGHRMAVALVGLVLSLFVLTRLPTGNLWDALIDPWLWVALQGGWLISLGRRWLARRRSSATTRV